MFTVNRVQPQGEPMDYVTYRLRAPLITHWRPATCPEVDCGPYRIGWATTVDERTELGQGQAHFIRHDRSRRHREERLPDGRTRFLFEPGQICFGVDAHVVPVGRPPLYLVQGGDWRVYRPPLVRAHTNADNWVDDFANHQDKLTTAHKRG